jgi:hypothetical protein
MLRAPPFQTLEGFQGRTRKWLYLFAGHVYELGCQYKEDDASFKLLADAPFFKDDREKPKKNNVMKTLAILGMSANPHQKELRGLAVRIGAVLEDFYVGGVPPVPTVVAEKLKTEGGIYKLYRRRSEKANADDVVQDDFDLLSDDGPETAGDERDAFKDEKTETSEDGTEDVPETDNTDDEHPDADEDAEQAASEDSGMSDNAIVLSGNMPIDDQVVPEAPAIARAANDQPDDVKREISIVQPKQGPLNRVDLKKELIVEFLPEEIDQILASGGGEIAFSLMPCDERGYVRAIGRLKWLYPRDDRQSPGDEPPAAP